ncbi:MAG: hypothetical protein O6703_02470, partial [Gammaproteobacteria bacterium]|nr:hypothetical protein [Gammaproteobacteria bacterium]
SLLENTLIIHLQELLAHKTDASHPVRYSRLFSGTSNMGYTVCRGGKKPANPAAWNALTSQQNIHFVPPANLSGSSYYE